MLDRRWPWLKWLLMLPIAAFAVVDTARLISVLRATA